MKVGLITSEADIPLVKKAKWKISQKSWIFATRNKTLEEFYQILQRLGNNMERNTNTPNILDDYPMIKLLYVVQMKQSKPSQGYFDSSTCIFGWYGMDACSWQMDKVIH